jgi:hypothetical protein
MIYIQVVTMSPSWASRVLLAPRSACAEPCCAALCCVLFPQVFVKGEFVGGSDILMEMHKAGELTQLADEMGH